ncbi:MAG: hypothetical protein PVG03_11855 [Desulfarculaceae bacterium]|jgi:hypothetical protein
MNAFFRLGLKVTAALCLLCLLLTCGHPASAGGRMLTITNPQTGLVARLPLAGVDSLAIRFFHSYDRQWVQESFKIAAGRFVPTGVIYKDDSYDYRDQRYRSRALVEPAQVRLVDIDPLPSDHLKSIATRIAHTKPQQLLLTKGSKTQVHLFSQWGRPGQPLVFCVR